MLYLVTKCEFDKNGKYTENNVYVAMYKDDLKLVAKYLKEFNDIEVVNPNDIITPGFHPTAYSNIKIRINKVNTIFDINKLVEGGYLTK